MDTTTDTTYLLKGCTDCLMLIANGDTSGNSRCETEEGEAEYLAAIAANTEGLHLCPGEWTPPVTTYEADDTDEFGNLFALLLSGEIEMDDVTYNAQFNEFVHEGWSETDRYYGTDREGHFTYEGCDVCGDGLGGDKYPVAAWPLNRTEGTNA